MKEKGKIATKTVQRPLKVECFYTPPLGNKCGKIFEVKYNRSCAIALNTKEKYSLVMGTAVKLPAVMVANISKNKYDNALLKDQQEEQELTNLKNEKDQFQNSVKNYEQGLKVVIGNDLTSSSDKDISDLQQKNADLTKDKEEAENQLKEKQQQILDHKCDTPNNNELNQLKDDLKKANQEKDRLQTELQTKLNKKDQNIPIPQQKGEEDKKEEQENQKLTVEELREKLTSKQREIRDLQEQLSKMNNSQSNQDNKQNPKFLLGMMTSFLPDITKKNQIGEIISVFEKKGLRIAGMKMIRLTPQLAKNFYQEHSERSFFKGMTEFMCSSPVVVICLEGENAIKLNREIMGATNPLEAKTSPKNATSLEKSKYFLRKKVLVYKQENNLPVEKLAKQINLTVPEVEDILFARIDKFTLDRLVIYIDNLFPFYLTVHEKSLSSLLVKLRVVE
ncbi:12064_t:CDS:2 [Funneliformis geosporum]|uniref:Nucleoside diphosphate kinase n=1 Tax=Funneliformis geosporum TaxID=1117311 RepID=A0A9W4SKN7_9GLOM|nr:12064_t:CDS:2 [Funneliformis geosporum]